MVQLADERRLLAEERSQLTISQRLVVEKQQEESLKQSQGSAKYEGMLCVSLGNEVAFILIYVDAMKCQQ